MKTKRAFSLIELLVVVAIIALLSAIAAPVYTQYSARAQLASLVNIMQGLLEQVQKTYSTTGTMPTSLAYKTSNLPQNTWVYVGDTTNHIFGLYYGNAPTNGKGAFISVSTTGINGSSWGYVAQTNPSTPYGNLYSEFQMGFIDLNNTLRYACGDSVPTPPSTGYVPVSVLPAACQCQQMGNYFNQTPTWTSANSSTSFPGC